MSGEGSITLRTRSRRNVRIGSHYHRLLVQIEIIDNGPGINPEILDQIFVPLVTGRADGTGLGLSISQTLVELQGGRIEIESEPGKGSEFSFSIPYSKASDQEITKLKEQSPTDFSVLKGIKILIAGANEFNQIVIKETSKKLLQKIKQSDRE